MANCLEGSSESLYIYYFASLLGLGNNNTVSPTIFIRTLGSLEKRYGGVLVITVFGTVAIIMSVVDKNLSQQRIEYCNNSQKIQKETHFRIIEVFYPHEFKNPNPTYLAVTDKDTFTLYERTFFKIDYTIKLGS